jgi:OOP family OmpA-OmpF porin
MTRSHLTTLALLLPAGLGMIQEAHAEGVSADIELIRPSFSEGSMPGVESPRIAEPGTVRGGLAIQYAKDPLILYEENDELGTVVANRQTLTLGVAWDLAKNFGFRATVPAAVQWGTETPELTREGPVLGDLMIGARVGVVQQERVAVGLRADLGVPSGTRAAWMGEARFRGVVGPTAMVTIRDVDLLGDVHMVARPVIPTDKDLELGSELVASAGVRYNVVRDQAAVGLSYVNRSGLDYFFKAGAENPSELLSVVQLRPVSHLQGELGFGKGLAEGYGTSAFRAYASLTWIRPPKADEPPPSLDLMRIPPPPEQVEVEPIIPEEPIWEEDEEAQIDGDQIIVRRPIEFEFATANILPTSLPTLQYMADLLNDNWQIAHLVIEGHASEEGSFVYNYDLSIRRSRAIWEELIRAGVHPDRMSYRGMGEVVPRNSGEDEVSLAGNRRVEFEIVRQYRPDETPEPMREGVRLPWSGEDAKVGTPPKPEAPPPPPPKPEDLDMDDFFEDDLDPMSPGAADDAPAPAADTPSETPPDGADAEATPDTSSDSPTDETQSDAPPVEPAPPIPEEQP